MWDLFRKGNKVKERELKSGKIEKQTSYITAISKDLEGIKDPEVCIERLKKSRLFDFKGLRVEDNIIVSVEYKNEIYEIELIPEDIEVPELFTINHKFNEEDYKLMMASEYGITTAMKFGESNIDSYHLQLKVLYCILPDMVGIVDFMSERILSSIWVKLTAESEIAPSPNYIYSVQVINDKGGTVWLHTHGLNRCGSIEFEVLNSNRNNYENHYNILQTIASRVISGEDMTDEEEAFLISYRTNGEPILATWISWELAVTFYNKAMVGTLNDRIGAMNNHNKYTGVVYIYLSENDYEKRKFSHVSSIDKYIKDNPIFMFTTEETTRMSMLAKERVSYYKEAIKNPDTKGLMKFGLLMDEEYRDEFSDGREHIWFVVNEVKDSNYLKGVLTQQPYYIRNLEVDCEVELSLEDLTDWILYTPNESITPDDVYLLEE